ncbi:hypothetical protein H8S20_02445 [Clostridium sp. NSJ-6]|uniref:Uncharacterized protein n=1 Tax=Clostridium hominis TaxID=2763036 RepID=A0ABR7DAM2_9CLOT|nr:hypothetical protein [Clostridium hominis]MBC5627743.1 hypothetical protein [Clostridium hominis]MDU2673000.1 hypothetical protein [Clostridium sp.]
MTILRIRIFVTRIQIYLFKKMIFLPRRTKSSIAKKLINDINIISNEMVCKKII